jgi:hypothetical protein
VDGVTWDYAASYQVVVNRYPTLEAYLERYGDYYQRRGRLLHRESMVVNGRRSVQALIARPVGTIEEVTLVESGDGRVLVVTAECPTAHRPTYAAWFDATLATLDVWD